MIHIEFIASCKEQGTVSPEFGPLFVRKFRILLEHGKFAKIRYW